MMNRKGFTLIELILYVTLSSVILTAFTLLVPYILETRLKNQLILEVEEQARYVSGVIGREIRNAESINSPSVGVSSSTLSLDAFDIADDPTVFSLNVDTIEVSRGGGVGVELLNDKIEVSNLSFTNLTKAGTSGAIRAEFTLNFVNLSGRDNFEYSRDYVLTGVIKQN